MARERLKRLRKRNIIVGFVCVFLLIGIIILGVRMSESDYKSPGYEATLKAMGADGTLQGVDKRSTEAIEK